MIITLMTNFGDTDPFAGIMKGVIKSLASGVDIIDLTHRVSPLDILAWTNIPESAIAPEEVGWAVRIGSRSIGKIAISGGDVRTALGLSAGDEVVAEKV